jgi:hypothetical protein
MMISIMQMFYPYRIQCRDILETRFDTTSQVLGRLAFRRYSAGKRPAESDRMLQAGALSRYVTGALCVQVVLRAKARYYIEAAGR